MIKCILEDCNNKHYARGLCRFHYRKYYYFKIPFPFLFMGPQKWTEENRKKYLKAFKRRDYHGENNPKWRGGKIKRPDGRTIVFAPGNPNAKLFGGTYILEYRLAAEVKIGRPLRDSEIVHHINGDTADNSLENLEVMTLAEHAKKHSETRNRDLLTGRFL